jgi:myo-inositol-1(or 4)-monophosphatase
MTRDLAAACELATELAAAAGRLQVDRRGDVVVGARKAHANDFVSDVDLASERLVVEGLTASWPGDGLVAEEGSSAPGTTGWRWVVDPLDGTRNYLTGAGPWSVCIALQENECTRVAVVHDPVAGETFSAVAGEGAQLRRATPPDAFPLSASAATRLDEAIVGLSFDPSPRTKRRIGRMMAELLPRIGDVRRVPAALNLAYTAAGRFDAAVVVDTRLWDVAAGLLLATEAGALVDPAHPSGPATILAGAPALWTDLSRAVAATP